MSCSLGPFFGLYFAEHHCLRVYWQGRAEDPCWLSACLLGSVSRACYVAPLLNAIACVCIGRGRADDPACGLSGSLPLDLNSGGLVCDASAEHHRQHHACVYHVHDVYGQRCMPMPLTSTVCVCVLAGGVVAELCACVSDCRPP
jgi:hypothetical protein